MQQGLSNLISGLDASNITDVIQLVLFTLHVLSMVVFSLSGVLFYINVHVGREATKPAPYTCILSVGHQMTIVVVEKDFWSHRPAEFSATNFPRAEILNSSITFNCEFEIIIIWSWS